MPIVSPQGDRDERRDRALRGDDRCDDRDLADAKRRVRQLQPDDVADPGQTEQSERRRLERRRDPGSRPRSAGPTTTPTTITQPSTTREPSIRLERDEQRVAAAQSTAAPRPPMMATTASVWRVASRVARSRVVRPYLCYHPPSRPALVPRRVPSTTHISRGSPTWPRRPAPGRALVRRPDSRGSVRPRRRHEVLQPRRTAAKTFVAKALSAAAQPAESTIDPIAALAEALSALDRAAKVGAIHPNAAARRKSRLTLKVNAALGGEQRRRPVAASSRRPARPPRRRPPRPASPPARPARPRAPRPLPARPAPR